MSKNKFACPVCSVNRAYRLRDGEQLIGFDIEPIKNDLERQRFMDVFSGILSPLVAVKKACLHLPRRFCFRGFADDRLVFGRLLRREAEQWNLNRLHVYADFFLEEGVFHPSRVHVLTEEELRAL